MMQKIKRATVQKGEKKPSHCQSRVEDESKAFLNLVLIQN